MEPWLERAAALRPNRTAVEATDGSLTYSELLARARRVALDVRPGDRVAIALPAGLDFAIVLHACLLAGAAAMPVDLRLTERERATMVRSAATVVDAPHEDGERATRRPDEHDVALVMQTSGTTGCRTATCWPRRSARPPPWASTRTSAGCARCRSATSAA
jgi:acyl-CoA synthetase (AMP-forming)/AMP-acid ligase II